MHDNELTHVRVLAIDKHPDVLNEVARIMNRLGYECLRASDMDEAARCVARHIPDLIVADANLAGLGGPAFCAELRRRCDLEGVPVMYLSSSQTPDIIRRADAGGGTYYLRKPFDAPVFVELVERTRRAPQQQLETV